MCVARAALAQSTFTKHGLFSTAASILTTDSHRSFPDQLNPGLPGKVTVAPFEWGDDIEALSGPWDLILGSDLCYQAEAVPKLLSSLAMLLDSPGTSALMSYELRPGFEHVHKELPAYGLQARQVWSCVSAQWPALLQCCYQHLEVPVQSDHHVCSDSESCNDSHGCCFAMFQVPQHQLSAEWRSPDILVWRIQRCSALEP